ncbi:MFS transporter [Ktedonobacter sp. SOSP1-85]|uniref:DHA2 family efflux MFS transporter permease subunit n=1 Tax=Ktedonobacter sp. SOSP1-85 TaxID=2778367 RepID=UPI001A32C4FA|nr:MFS transporter [Ktedonobacter sp. SOSP1-85]
MKEKSKKAASIWVLALTSVASFMISLDVQVVSTALSTIRLHLGASIEELEWTVNAYILTFAVLLLTGAALGDRFGRRRLFVAGLLLFVAASAACALAPTIGALITARAVQGCGAALMLPLALTLLSAAFEPAQRGRALGIFGSVTGLALIAGPVVGGAIAGGLAWRWIFWLNVPIGLLVIVLVSLRVPESRGPRTVLDLGGLLLVSGAALGLAWGLVRGNRAGWGSFEVVATLLAGTGLVVAFVAWELRVHVPMVSMRFFRSRAFSSGNAANFLLFASMNGAVFFMAQFLQTAQGYGPLASGLRLLPWTATLFVVAPIAGALVNRVGERVLIVVGLLAEAAGMIWIALIARPDLPYPELVAPLIIAGCGASMAIPATQNAVINSVAAHEIGKASGTFSMLRQLSGVFGVAILAAVFAGVGSFSSAQAFSNGFASAISVASALALMGAISGLVLPGRRDKAFVRTTEQAPETREHERDSLLEQSPVL